MSETKEYMCGKCFVMMPISDQGNYERGHFDKVYEQIFKPAIEAAGYEPYRVDENKISSSIIEKIFKAIIECDMALCDLSNRNPNVLYELGIRQAYNKPVVLVQDDETEKIFDIAGISTVYYKSNRLYENVISAKEKIEAAINSTREGKEMSLIQYINVASAEYTPEDNENNVNIMLKSILNQLSELKEGENLFDYAKRNYFRSVRYVVNKHEGLTKKLLFERITNMRNIFHKKISYTNKKEYLIIEVVDIETQEIEDQIKQFINEYIGIIKE